MTTAERAAAPLLPDIPARRPGEAGQFAFAERDRILQILEQSGWADIDIQPIDVACRLPEHALFAYLTQLGPLGRHLRQADAQTISQVMAVVLPAFQPYVQGTDVCYNAACWMVTARSNPAIFARARQQL